MSSPNSKLPNLTTTVEDFIEKVEENSQTALYEMTPSEAREFLKKLQKKYYREIDADVQDTSVFVGGNNEKFVPIRVVRPKNSKEKLPLIYYLHGGGWVLGSKEEYDMLIRKISVYANAAVIFPEYSLSPEAQYPEAINEIYDVLDYVSQNPDEFNIDNSKIAIFGDSAGANMAAVTALRSKNNHGAKIVFQCLFYPVTNSDMDTESYKSFQDGPWLTKKAMEWFWESYVPEKKLREDSYVSPLKADVEDLKGLPPTLVITAENDVLRDEGEAFARKLEIAGVDVVSFRTNGTIHDFLMLNALSDTIQAKWTIKLACCLFKDVV